MNEFAVLSILVVLFAAGVVWWLVHGRSRLWPEPPHTDVAEVGPWRIHYQRGGKGPALLLIHGIGANHLCWGPLIPFLSSHFTWIAVDLPGFGQSSKIDGENYGLDTQVDRLAEFLAGLGIKECFVVGNSMGGNIALWLSLRYLELIKGVAVIAPATSPRLVPLPAQGLKVLAGPARWLLTKGMMRWAHELTVTRKDRLESVRIDQTYQTYKESPLAIRTFLAATEAIRDPRLPKALREIADPVLVLWGSEDRLVPRKVITELQSTLREVEFHEHIGGGHHLQEDEPEWVSLRLQKFFLEQRRS